MTFNDVGSRAQDSAGNFIDINPVTANIALVTIESAGSITSSGIANGSDIINPGYSGISMHLDVTKAASTGSATLDITIQGKDAVTGGYYNLPDAAFEQVATSTTQEVLFIHPMTVSDSGAGFIRTPIMLPLTFRVQTSAQVLASGDDGSTYTYTISGEYVI